MESTPARPTGTTSSPESDIHLPVSLAVRLIGARLDQLDAAIETVLGDAAARCAADRAFIVQYPLDEGESLQVTVTHRWLADPALARDDSLTAGLPLVLLALQSGHGSHLPDVGVLTAGAARDAYTRAQVASLWCGPLTWEDDHFGCVCFETAENPALWEAETYDFLEQVALLLAGALNRQREETRRLRETSAESDLLHTVIAHLPDKIYVKDRQSRFVLANPAVAERFGLPSTDDLIGRTDYDFMERAAADRYYGSEQMVLATGHPIINQEESYVDSGGRRRWLLLTKVPLRDESGEVVALVGIHRDISGLKETQEQLAQVVSAARCLLWTAVVDSVDGQLEWDVQVSNEEAARRFLPLLVPAGSDYTSEWLDSRLPEDQEGAREISHNAITLGLPRYATEYRCRLDNGEVRWLNEDVQIQQINETRWVLVGVCADVTIRKQAEESLRDMRDSLQQRIQERTAEVHALTGKLMTQMEEREHAEESVRTTLRQFEALYTTSQKLITAQDIQSLLEAFVAPVMAAEPGYAALFRVVETTTGHPDFVELAAQTEHDTIKGIPLGSRFDVADFEIAGMILNQPNQVHSIPEVETASDEQYGQIKQLALYTQTKAVALIPLVAPDRGWVGVAVLSWPHTYEMPPDLLMLYSALGSQFAALIENRQLVGELRVARDHATEAARMKSVFLAQMTQDLREPLIAALQDADALVQSDDLPPDLGERISHIYARNWALLETIDEVLDIARLEAGLMEIESARFATGDLLDHWRSGMGALSKRARIPFKIEIAPDLPEALVGDKGRILQIVDNLLSNAFKFTTLGEVCMALKYEQDELVIVVRDTGIGIDPDAVDGLMRGEGVLRRRSDGRGMGLYIARQLVRAMDGGIALDSQVGVGSTFTVRLPLLPA